MKMDLEKKKNLAHLNNVELGSAVISVLAKLSVKDEVKNENPKRLRCNNCQNYWETEGKSWNSKVRVKTHESRVRIHELQVRIHELRVAFHELRVQIHESLNQ